jgi:hypothetical protein
MTCSAFLLEPEKGDSLCPPALHSRKYVQRKLYYFLGLVLHGEKSICAVLSGKRFPPSPYRFAPGGSLPCREHHWLFFAPLCNAARQ